MTRGLGTLPLLALLAAVVIRAGLVLNLTGIAVIVAIGWLLVPRVFAG